MRICPKCFAQESDEAVFCGHCAHKLLDVSKPSGMVGRLLNGKYLIERLVAHGGMGEVYLAEQAGIQQKVAIKLLNRRFNRDETVVRRFVNEARSYGKISHPNAVKIFDLQQLEDDTLYIAMEYVHGETLTQHLEGRGPMPETLVLSLSVQLADVLAYAHQQGVIHRDLKSDNIMLIETSPGRFMIKVLDFGIAKIVDESSAQLTEAGMVFGTPEFMSPEQAQGLEVDARTDIYAFGVLLYYMLTHRLPFGATNKIAILNKQIHEAPVPPSMVPDPPEISPGLESLIMMCLRKKCSDRYQSFTEVLSDLERIIAGRAPQVAPAFDAAQMPSFVSISDEEEQAWSVVVTRAEDPLQAMFDSAPDELRSGEEALSFEGDAEVADTLLLGGEGASTSSASRQASSGALTLGGASRASGEAYVLEVKARPSGAFVLGDDSDEDGFSLGGDEVLAERPHDDGRGSSMGVFFPLLLVLILGGGGLGAWLWWSAAGSDEATKATGAQVGEVEDVVPALEADTDFHDSESAAEVPTPAPILEPVPASTLFTPAMLERATVRSMTEVAAEMVAAGRLPEAEALLKRSQGRAKGLPERYAEALAEVRADLEWLKTRVRDAQRNAQRLRCREIEAEIEAVREKSAAVAEVMATQLQNCRRALTAPPTRVD